MRHIKQELVTYIDNKLSLNGLAQDAIKNKDARTLLVQAASACVGIREATNNNDGPMVELIQSTIGRAEHESWCMAFVQSMIAYVETKLNFTSPFHASEHCLTVWNNTPESYRVKTMPLAGAIAIWRHGTSSSGHTGVVLSADESMFLATEGNTESGTLSTSDKIVRNGGGVYFTKRSMQGFPHIKTLGEMSLVGFIKPF